MKIWKQQESIMNMQLLFSDVLKKPRNILRIPLLVKKVNKNLILCEGDVYDTHSENIIWFYIINREQKLIRKTKAEFGRKTVLSDFEIVIVECKTLVKVETQLVFFPEKKFHYVYNLTDNKMAR